MPTAPPPPTVVPSLARLFALWFTIGIQSFGGGTATQELIRRVAVDRERWVDEAAFARELTLVQLAPGMNLLALTLLLGRRVRGVPGAVVSLLAMLVPAVAAAIALAALARSLGDNPYVRSALSGGVVPATVGMGLYGSFRTGRGLLKGTRKGRLAACLLIAGGSAATAALLPGRVPVIAILGAGGLLGALLGVISPPKAPPVTDAAVAPEEAAV
jgi:Chromate transport protein ChrA